MKFLLLKALLKSRAKDQGFTLPLVIGIGFVMVLLSTVSLVQSGEENLNALSQQGSSDSLAMAEIGLARYRNVLNNNRALAVRDLILTDASGNPIPDAFGNPINDWQTFENQTCDVINNLADNTVWQDIVIPDIDNPGNTIAIGSYRLVNYQYDQDPTDGNLNDDNNFDQINDANNDFNGDGNSDARGFLTIQGKDTPGNVLGNSSISQVQVEIPLGVNTTDLDDLNPGVWIEQSRATINTGVGIGTVNTTGNANLVYKEFSTGCPVVSADVITDPRDLPLPATLAGVTTSRNLNFGNLSGNNGGSEINFFNSNEIILGTSLDNTGATAALDNGVYYYNVPGGLTINANEAIISDGTSEVILIVNGDLTINTGGAGDEVRLINSSHESETGAPTPTEVDRYLEIHVTGNVIINGGGDLDITGLLRVGQAFNNSATVNVTGAIWAGDWNNSGTVNVTTDDFRFYSITPNRTPAPLTYRPSGWETQEAS